jgi:glycosyltransferase involved in cell wall biosynthesis
MCATALRLKADCIDSLAHHILMLERAVSACGDFDIVHFHTDYLHFPLARRMATPHVTTLHGRLDLPDLSPIHHEFRDMPLVSISDAQRRPLPWANWQKTIHHGLPSDLYQLEAKPGKYLAFLGRISPEKRVDRAIQIAKRCGIRLMIAAKIDKVDREYVEAQIRPLLDDPLVEYIGEIGDHEKPAFLSNALALLLPVDWPEPFGLVTIEAMACGTPVIAWPHGAIPEIIEPGITGFLIHSIEQAAQAVERSATIDRKRCRHTFEQRFTSDRMARDYITLYQQRIDPAPRQERPLPNEVLDERNRSDQGSTLHSGDLLAR